MSYPGGRGNGYWPGQDQNPIYGSPNSRQPPMPNGSPGAYYQPRPPQQQHQVQQQQWAQNGANGHAQYTQNSYMMNQGYPSIPQQQYVQPQYYTPPQPQMQQRYSQPQSQPQQQPQLQPQPQTLKRPHSIASYPEPPQKRVNHNSYNSPQYSVQNSFSPQPSHASRPPQPSLSHQSVTVTPSNILSRSVESPTISQSNSHSPHIERSTISPSNFITNPPERTTISPANLVNRSPERQTISPANVMPYVPERYSNSPANTMARAPERNTKSPANAMPRAPERNTKSPANAVPHVPERKTDSPSNIVPRALEQATINPANILSRPEPTTINPSEILSRPEKATTISPSSLMSGPAQTTISPSNIMSASSGQATIEPSKLLAPRASTPPQRQQQQLSVPMLLVSLAEEYFEAAHKLAPGTASGLDESHVEAYNQLIATGLACLEGAIKKVRLPPRLEANIILRFAGVLYEEDTDNFMDAEVALTKGIALCERNRYLDLKYAMQFLLAQFMFKKNPKMAMKALDGYISDSHAYHHYSWLYAFRFLRAARAMDAGIITESHSGLQNISAISQTATEQSDRGIFLLASLMEAMAYMQSASPDALDNVQRAIASAWTYQLDEDNQIPQLTALTHILDVACSLRQGDLKQMYRKIKSMQVMMDGEQKYSKWSFTSDVLAIPISRKRQDSHTVSRDTRSVLGIGNDGRDNLMISFLSRRDAEFISRLLYGLILGRNRPANGLKVFSETLKFITDTDQHPKGNLPDVLRQSNWQDQILCCLYIYTAFCRAAVTDWRAMGKNVLELKSRIKRPNSALPEPLVCLAVYVEGVYYQGIGNLKEALKIFRDSKFELLTLKSTHLSSVDEMKRDLSILAALNSVLISQEESSRDLNNNKELLDKLEPFCKDHHNRDIQTAFQLLVATVQTQPPQPFLKTKEFLQYALHGSQTTNNTIFLSIVLTLTYNKFFTNIVGDQAIKSAMAASTQAKNSGNALWASVATAQLAQCYSAHGKTKEAEESLNEAKKLNQRAFPDI